jgi:nifR3 family TIM-barrel protein
MLPKNENNCPYLLLAPMEGVGDSIFRKAINLVGGFDEAVRDFLRVPSNAHVKSLAKAYDPKELGNTKLAVQIMGSDPDLMAEMACELETLGAFRIDVNCGCPSNTVTGRGAGSSLLKDPSFLHDVVKSVVKAVKIPVTVKMRSGYDDTSLFEENLLAAQDANVKYITLHPRTKVDGYTPPAKWELIAQAKSILKIPVVGNGDILTVQNAVDMLRQTNCDALMIGRGCVIDPFIFKKIKAHFANEPFEFNRKDLLEYLNAYLNNLYKDMPLKIQIGKMKQLLGFIFKQNETLLEKREKILKSTLSSPQELLEFATEFL